MHSDPLDLLPVAFAEEAARLLDLPTLSLTLRSEWGSAHANHRSLIRQHIFDQVENSAALLDLQQIPRLAKGALSISHCKDIGGYAQTFAAVSLGFDVEAQARLNEKNVLRFASVEEVDSAPNASALWTAKEALYKSLHFSLQPVVIGEIELKNWKAIEKNWYLCQNAEVRKKNFSDTLGVIFCGEKHTLALFKGPFKGPTV